MMHADFQTFQRNFAQRLRDPQHVALPDGVSARRMAVYEELLFNNIGSFLDTCLPVCRSLVSSKRWQGLKRSFYRDWPLHTPWFREIPREFVNYVASTEGLRLPAWFAELAHYEWAELAVDVMETNTPPHHANGDLLHGVVVLNPALMNLSYAWPVQHIAPSYRPRKPAATQLVVYRDADDMVQFSAVNAVTARLITLLAAQSQSGEAALRQLAAELQHPAPEQLLVFGKTLLADLQQQGIILGAMP